MRKYMDNDGFTTVFNCKKRIVLVLFALVVFSSISSCEINKVIKVSGIVVNKATQKPIEGVKVKFNDGIDVSGPIDFGGTAPQHSDSTYTDRNGKFKIELKTSSGGGFLYLTKEGYNYSHPHGGGIYPVNEPGVENAIIQMDGIALFNPVLAKKSAVAQESDELIVTTLEDINIEWERIKKTFNGKGPFSFWSIDQNEGLDATGDRYLRYKIKFTTNGIWNTKIDSVYLPTSLKVFRDTIYY
jgi:hypothetical protein